MSVDDLGNNSPLHSQKPILAGRLKKMYPLKKSVGSNNRLIRRHLERKARKEAKKNRSKP